MYKENKQKRVVKGYSLFLNKTLFAKVTVDFLQLSINKKLLETLPLTGFTSQADIKNPWNYVRLTFDNTENCRSALYAVTEYFSLNYTPSERFGCCHRYIECSDAKECTLNDKFRARGCYYRENLEKGKIFYGKNANI